MRKILLTCLVAVLSVLVSQGQDCKVLLNDISLNYTGDCKDKKAEGHGKATGADAYEGEFKAGYPDGPGKYVWKTGDWFDGLWKKGSREGMGEMHYKTQSGQDSIVKGFWKKNQYFGKFEKPYVVISKTSKVNTVRITKSTDKQPNITITVQSATGGITVVSQKPDAEKPVVDDIPKVKLTGVEVIKGNFISQSTMDNNSARSTKAILNTVEFPFRVILRISDTHIVELEFFEEGNYLVDIDILN